METAAAVAPARKFEKVVQILDAHKRDRTRLVPILQAVQEEYRYLPEEVMTLVATSLGIPPARVYGVATFYSHFALEPKGKYVIRICDGTACHVKGSQDLVDALQAGLNLGGARKTTPDMMFTLETVSCLGACGLAPAMVVNEDVHGQVSPAGAMEILDGIRRSEGM
ncbi:MAG TPA: NADH-quinone oxidoreductase subunit NuoE [Holophaga sp.]|nr:NADH-quinone oxidoreductase subunit NuoE [Holophaga sp.]